MKKCLLIIALGLLLVSGCDSYGVPEVVAEMPQLPAVEEEKATEAEAQTEAETKTEDIVQTEAKEEEKPEHVKGQEAKTKTKAKSKTKSKNKAKNKGQNKEKLDSKSNNSKKAEKAQWLFYSSTKGSIISSKQKAKLDSLVGAWTNGKISDGTMELKLEEYLLSENIDFSTAGVASGRKCIFESKKDIPDYRGQLRQRHGIYNFIGLYTEGKRDEAGNLICYYWEAGVM